MTAKKAKPIPGARLWHANVTSFAPFAFNAEHYYVTIRVGGTDEIGTGSRKVEVMQRISADQAAALNRKDNRHVTSIFTWHEGSHTNRFDTEQECFDAARAAWLAVRTEGDGLVADGYTTPVAVLDGPKDFVVLGNKINDEHEALGPWTKELDQPLTALRNQFDLLVEHWFDDVDQTHFGAGSAEKERIDVVVKRGDKGWVVTDEEEVSRWD